MTQNREAPAFQEYAANMLARTDFRVLSLEERGLLYTLRLELWVNREMPAEPAVLARVLGCNLEDVAQALPRLGAFFDLDGNRLRCPELDNYRAHLEDRSRRQSEGGRKGAKTANGRRQDLKPTTPQVTRGQAAGTPLVSRRHPAGKPRLLSTEQPNTDQPNTGLDGGGIRDWVNDYDRASNGH